MGILLDKVIDAIETRGVQLEKKNWGWQGPSPLREGSDGTGFCIWENSGSWEDYPGGTKGSLKELAELLGVEVFRKSYKDMKHYLAEHGINEEIAKKAKWKQVIRFDRPAIQFVTKGGTRWRFLDSKTPKFISENGYTLCVYGLENAMSISQNKELVLCNGEPSVLAGQSFDIPAIAISSGEKGFVPTEVLSDLEKVKDFQITILFDSDRTGTMAAYRLNKLLLYHGYKSRAKDFKKQDGYDLADFCKDYKAGAKQAYSKLPELIPDISLLNDSEKIASILLKQISVMKGDLDPVDLNYMLEVLKNGNKNSAF